MNTPPDDGVWITDSQDPETGAPICLIRWGEHTTPVSVDDAFATARDLFAAAAHAETDKALVEELIHGGGLDLQTAGVMLSRVRERRTPAPAPGRPALRIEAVYGFRTCMPYVHIARGSHKAELTPDEARTMGQHWLETAQASLLGVRFRYALGDHLTPDTINTVFAAVQDIQLRKDGYR
ncbi:hypothetical protein ACIRLA_46610 [Streptomyces sp. NPDC102364]|uniref:hypothetical protein n=1 Tax=Streptomyces sp. NPDC102364 TaxID=3366161 RepID=UPI0037F200A4